MNQQVWILQDQTIVTVPRTDSVTPGEWSSCGCCLGGKGGVMLAHMGCWHWPCVQRQLYKRAHVEGGDSHTCLGRGVLGSRRAAFSDLMACHMEEEYLILPDFWVS